MYRLMKAFNVFFISFVGTFFVLVMIVMCSQVGDIPPIMLWLLIAACGLSLTGLVLSGMREKEDLSDFSAARSQAESGEYDHHD